MKHRTGLPRADAILRRDASIAAAPVINVEARTAILSFASAAPVERWFGFETLEISHKAIITDRLRDGAALLLNHDADQQIGVVESVAIGTDKARARVRFGNSPLARQVFDDVQDEIRSKVSVGYFVHSMEKVAEGSKDTPATFRVTLWEPLEISIVAVPADASVGIGRSATPTGEFLMTKTQRRLKNRADQLRADALLAAVPPDDVDEVLDVLENDEVLARGGDEVVMRTLGSAAESYEDLRATTIQNLADIAGGLTSVRAPEIHALARAAVTSGASIKQFRGELMQMIQTEPTHTGRVEPMPAAYGSLPREETYSGPLRAFPPGREGQAAAFRAGMWYKSLAGDQRAAEWCRQHGLMQTRVMSEGIFTSGGSLVPEELSGDLLRNVELYGVARRFCRRWPMNSASTAIPLRVSGVTAYFVGETDAATPSDPSTSNVVLTAKELVCATRVSNSLMDDSVIAVGDFITVEMAQAMATTEDTCLLTGTGTSATGGMTGIISRLLTSSYAGGRSTATSGNDTFAEFTTTDIANLMGLCPESAKQNGAAFFCSSTFKDAVLTRLALAAGGNTTESIQQGIKSFGGYPIIVTPLMKSDPAEDLSSLIPLLFGSMSRAAVMGNRKEITMVADASRYVEYRQVYFQAVERFDVVPFDVGTATAAGQIVGLYGN